VYPHLLRRSVATTLLEQGMPIEQIQKFLGHSKLETTQVYAESSTEMLRESYQRALSRCAYLLHTSARVTCVSQWVVSYPPRCSTSSLRVAA
jgi:DNA-binding transcriptional MerR regulator